MATTLTYANHRKIVALFHYVVLPVTTINALISVWYMGASIWDGKLTFWIAWAAIVNIVLAIAAVYVRSFPLGVQDRVIRLEQRLRLTQLLPTELQPVVSRLTTEQLIALRFASDGEVADLVRACRETPGIRGEDLKKRIVTWVPDPARI